LLNRSRQGRQRTLHATHQIQPPFEIDTLDQHGDGNLLATLDLLSTPIEK